MIAHLNGTTVKHMIQFSATVIFYAMLAKHDSIHLAILFGTSKVYAVPFGRAMITNHVHLSLR